MRAHIGTVLVLVAFIAGCDAPPASDSAGTGAVANNSASATSPAAPTGEEGFRAFAECAATFEAVANLFDAAASQHSGARAEDARSTAALRRSAAAVAAIRAGEIGLPLGRNLEDVERIRRERQMAMERERARQDFGDFAIWLGRESDRCMALDPSFRRP